MKKWIYLMLLVGIYLTQSLFASEDIPVFYYEGKYIKSLNHMSRGDAAQYVNGMNNYFKNYSSGRFCNYVKNPVEKIIDSLQVPIEKYVQNTEFDIITIETGEYQSGPLARPGHSDNNYNSETGKMDSVVPMYDRGWLEAEKNFENDKNGKKITMEKHYQLAIKAFIKGDFFQARIRFAYIVRNEKRDAKKMFRIPALWYIAMCQDRTNNEDALETFLLSYRQAPNFNRKQTLAYITKYLLHHAWMGCCGKKHKKSMYKQCIRVAKYWLSTYKVDKLAPLVLSTEAYAYRGLLKPYRAAEIFRQITEEYPTSKEAIDAQKMLDKKTYY